MQQEVEEEETGTAEQTTAHYLHLQQQQPASGRMYGSKSVQKALVLATGAAVISIACAAVLAKSVCSWIWGSNKKQVSDTNQAEAAAASSPSQVSWVDAFL